MTIESLRIKTDKITPAVTSALNLALADLWDWEHPGRLHAPPPDWDGTKESFGAYTNTGWVVHTEGDLAGWSEYGVSDIQTDFRVTPQWVNEIKDLLRDAGLNVNKDIKIVKE